MPGRTDMRHSILIVSASEQFDAAVRKTLKGFMMVDSRKSVALARRSVLERYYDLVVIHFPMPDEAGEQFALDVTEQCRASVLLVVPVEIYEEVLEYVSDRGILAISKPMIHERLDKAIRFLLSVQNRMHELEERVQTVEEKMEEIRIINKAKFLLVERERMTEDEAHRFIGKSAMDNGISRKRAAMRLLEDLE